MNKLTLPLLLLALAAQGFAQAPAKAPAQKKAKPAAAPAKAPAAKAAAKPASKAAAAAPAAPAVQPPAPVKQLSVEELIDSTSPLVTVQAIGPVRLFQGGQGLAMLRVKVAPGYHIQSNPPGLPYLIPTTLSISTGVGITPGAPVYPEAKMFKIEGSTQAIPVYDGTFGLRAPIRSTSDAPTGNNSLKASLRYQACNDKTCLFPKTENFEIPVLVDIRR